MVNKRKQKILRPALLRGREWCVHHLPKSKHLHPWVVRLRAACFDAYRLVWRGPGRAGRLPCGRLHGAAWLEAAASAARERGRRVWPGGGRGRVPRPFAGNEAWSAAPRRSSPRNGGMTRPQKPPLRVQCPDTRGSDRDHHPAPGNDRIQKRTGGRASLKRRVLKKTFRP